MIYCTLEDISKQLTEAELIQLTDDENTGNVAIDVVEFAIKSAGELMDGFLRTRYSIPLQEVPDLIRDIAVELTIYKLCKRRVGRDIPESVKDRYTENMKLLDKIQKGQLLLGVEPVSNPTSEGLIRTNKTFEDKIFGKDTLSGY